MEFDGLDRQIQNGSHFLVASAVDQQLKDLPLTFAQLPFLPVEIATSHLQPGPALAPKISRVKRRNRASAILGIVMLVLAGYLLPVSREQNMQAVLISGESLPRMIAFQGKVELSRATAEIVLQELADEQRR